VGKASTSPPSPTVVSGAGVHVTTSGLWSSDHDLEPVRGRPQGRPECHRERAREALQGLPPDHSHRGAYGALQDSLQPCWGSQRAALDEYVATPGVHHEGLDRTCAGMLSSRAKASQGSTSQSSKAAKDDP